VSDGEKPPTPLIENDAFITDMARFTEGSLSQKQIRKKYRFDDATWEKLGSDDLICERIEDERIRRERSGQAKRELAQKHIVRGPDVLNSIMLDANANNRHRVDAIKTLDELAANAPQTVPPAAAAERFQIIINLGAGEILTFDKSITPQPHDDINNAPQELLIAANKREEDDGGEPL
jgi:hypothetical protein